MILDLRVPVSHMKDTMVFMVRVLLVEDDFDLAAQVGRFLTRVNHEVMVCGTVREANRHAVSHRPEIIVLDLGLPDGDGLDVVRHVRLAQLQTPILVLTGRVSEVDTVVALDAGADDFLAKPFRPHELLARIRSLSRRTRGMLATPPLGDDHVRLEVGTHRCVVDGREVPVPPTAFQLLALLIGADGAALTTGALERSLDLVSTESLRMHISAARKAIAPYGDRLVAIRSYGYRYDPAA